LEVTPTQLAPFCIFLYIGEMKASNKPRFPYIFEKNGRTGRIYKTSNNTYKTYFIFAHKPDHNCFTKFERAKSYLSNEFDKLDTQAADSASQYPLSRDRKYYHELEELLRSETEGATLRDAVDFYLSTRPKTKFKPLTVEECSKKFLESKKSAELSSVQIRALKKHLKRFGETFAAKKIHEITTEEIEDWLKSQKSKTTNRKWSNKYQLNFIGSLVTFARYSKKTLKAFPQGLLPTDFEQVEKPKQKRKDEVAVYSPQELRSQLDAAISNDIEIIPLIVLGAFFGLRPSEAHGEETDKPKLKWDAFDWHHQFLNVRFQKVRERSTRIVRIHPTAELWLEPFKKQSGVIWKYKAAYDERLQKICEKSGCSKINNGYRHSYASYRIIHLKHNYSELAGEMGNSEREVINSYRRSVLPQVADEWFQVKPPRGYKGKVKAFLSKVSS